VSVITDVLVSLAMSLKPTVPRFIILAALARSAPHLITRRDAV
jgi:hypothetical protein